MSSKILSAASFSLGRLKVGALGHGRPTRPRVAEKAGLVSYIRRSLSVAAVRAQAKFLLIDFILLQMDVPFAKILTHQPNPNKL